MGAAPYPIERLFRESTELGAASARGDHVDCAPGELFEEARRGAEPEISSGIRAPERRVSTYRFTGDRRIAKDVQHIVGDLIA